MINVLIKDDNAFYDWSIHTFLTEIVEQEYHKSVHLIRDFTHATVSQADVIMMGMCQGEHFTCHPELHARTKGGIIALMDKKPINITPSPECITDIVYIERRAPLSVIREGIIQVWKLHEESRSSNCYACRYRALSPQQIRIMAGFYSGKPVSQIALELDVTDKTIFSHKYQMMAKFNLASDYELLKLLDRLYERRLYSHLFEK